MRSKVQKVSKDARLWYSVAESFIYGFILTFISGVLNIITATLAPNTYNGLFSIGYPNFVIGVVMLLSLPGLFYLWSVISGRWRFNWFHVASYIVGVTFAWYFISSWFRWAYSA